MREIAEIIRESEVGLSHESRDRRETLARMYVGRLQTTC